MEEARTDQEQREAEAEGSSGKKRAEWMRAWLLPRGRREWIMWAEMNTSRARGERSGTHWTGEAALAGGRRTW